MDESATATPPRAASSREQAAETALEWRCGWSAVAGSMLGTGAGLSMFIAVFGFFVKPLTAEFGWSRGQVAVTSAAILSTSLLLPFVGAIADRRGVRPLVAIGCLAFAACYTALAMMNGAYWQFLAIIAVVGLLGGPVTAPFVFARPIVVAFSRSRGLALATTMSGVPLLSFLLLPAIQHLIAHSGWRVAFLMMAPATLALGVSAFLLLGRSRPAEGQAAGPRTGEVLPERAGADLLAAMGDSRFWLLALAMLTANISVGAFLTSLQPLLSDKGVPGGAAAMLGVWQATAVVGGRLVFGVLLDRFWPPIVAFAALGLPAFGLLLFTATGPDIAILAVAIALVATAIGAEGEILALFTARYFGLRSFGAVFGVLGLIYGVSVASGGLIAGFMFDRFGDYDRVLVAGAVLSAIAAACMLGSGHLDGRRGS